MKFPFFNILGCIYGFIFICMAGGSMGPYAHTAESTSSSILSIEREVQLSVVPETGFILFSWTEMAGYEE